MPALTGPLPVGDHTLACLVYATPRPDVAPISDAELSVPAAAVALLERCAAQEVPS